MKGQITRHEFKRDTVHWIKRCKHCHAVKILTGDSKQPPVYRTATEIVFTGKIPKCITRKKPEDEKTILE